MKIAINLINETQSTAHSFCNLITGMTNMSYKNQCYAKSSIKGRFVCGGVCVFLFREST